jgi:hypothetical protein
MKINVPTIQFNFIWREDMKKKSIYFVLLVVMVVLAVGCTPGTGVQIKTPVQPTPSGTPAPNGEIVVPGFNINLNAPGVNPLVNKPNANGRVADLLIGIWHGIISPGTLLVSLSNPNVQMYEVYNNGSQYNLGFLLGVAIIFLIIGILLGRR